jgi:hypothetical protein
VLVLQELEALTPSQVQVWAVAVAEQMGVVMAEMDLTILQDQADCMEVAVVLRQATHQLRELAQEAQ